MSTENNSISDTKSTTSSSASFRSHQQPHPHRGEIWFADLGCHPNTHVQEGCRPVLVVSNDVANHYADTVTVVPLTTRMKKPNMPTHVEVGDTDISVADFEGEFLNSMLLIEQVTTIDKKAFRRLVGSVIKEEKIEEIETALRSQLGMKDCFDERQEGKTALPHQESRQENRQEDQQENRQEDQQED